MSEPIDNLPIDLQAGAESHFRLLVYGAVARVLANLDGAGGPAGDLFAAFPFLAGYAAALAAYQPAELPAGQAGHWWEAQAAALAAAEPAHLPLRALRDELGLSPGELRLLLAAGLVEEDIRFGALFGALQAPLAGRRPCVGALGWLLAEPGGPAGDPWPAARLLLAHGLLHVENRGDPRAEWQLRVPPPLWDALRSAPDPTPAPCLRQHAPDGFPPLRAVVLPDELRERVGRLPGLLASGQVQTLVLRGMDGVGRRTLAGAVAAALGRGLLVWDGAPDDEGHRLLGPLATLTGAMPLLRCDPGPGETLELSELPGYGGPLAIAMGRGGGLRGPLVERALSLSLPPPGPAARQQLWRGAGAPLDPAEEPQVVGRFLLTAGGIARAAGLAGAYAALVGRDLAGVDDVAEATRALSRQALETLAERLDAAAGWGELVVGPGTMGELRTLEARCRARERLRDHAGPAFASSLNRGVRALFSGPSGTGKTLGARALAGALQMDLYRVDLAAVVNKYIGETERNLNQVLSRAEELDVLLLLDEGDALMTARTEVRSANDRYANLETNYLLQRLERYEGVVVVTSNAAQRIDTAFLRRLDVTVEFAPPDAGERLRIWQMHLPASHEAPVALLEEVAQRCALTGGQIRNAALHAILLALGAGGPVGAAHLAEALRREYRRAGAAFPMEPEAHDGGQVARLRRLVGSMG